MENSESRKLIYQAAKKLFFRDGYTHTTMRGIAGEAGTSVGLPIYYYGSKEKLGVLIYGEVRDKLNAVCFAYYPAPEHAMDRRHLATLSDILLLIDNASYRELYVNVAGSQEMGTYMSKLLPEFNSEGGKFQYLNSLTVSAVKARLVSADLEKYALTREELAQFMFQRYLKLQEYEYSGQADSLFCRFYREYHAFQFRIGESFLLEYDPSVLRRRRESLAAEERESRNA